MRLDVITGTPQEYKAALPCPAEENRIEAFCLDQLESAAKAEADRLDFQSAPPREKTSENFGLYGLIERTIVEFLRENEFPKEVRIICDSDETAKEYRVVYNFWFAETKASRLNDGTWD